VGKTIVAAHTVILPANAQQPSADKITSYFAGNPAVGATMTAGDAQAFTDFRIHNDGFSRNSLFDNFVIGFCRAKAKLTMGNMAFNFGSQARHLIE
jgi:uncharacterized membrane-anchored protein